MPYISGYLIEGGVNNELPDAPGRVDNTLPGGTLPGYGGLPPMAGNLPAGPPMVWPPLSPSNPIESAPPGTPPGTIWPSPGAPDRPDNSLPSTGRPDQALPARTYWVVAGIPGVGWRYVAVDPSLKPGHALPPAPQPK